MAIFTLFFWLLTASFSPFGGPGGHTPAPSPGHTGSHHPVARHAMDVGGMPPG